MAGVLSLFDLTGRKALVTGAGQGLGRSMALALAEAGADVAVVDLHTETGQSAAAAIRALGRKAIVIQADVSQQDQVQAMAKEAERSLGPIDILLNNAGISSHIDSDKMPLSDWQKVLDVNITGVFLCCQAFAPLMKARRYGRIISTASMSGLIVNKDVPQAPYYASKAGVIMLTKALAAEWGAFNITVNAIAPGYMRTPLTRVSWPIRCAPSSGPTVCRLAAWASHAIWAGRRCFLASEASALHHRPHAGRRWWVHALVAANRLIPIILGSPLT